MKAALIFAALLFVLVPTWWQLWHVGNLEGWWPCSQAECAVLN
jgi:hypothetical protein